MFIAEDFLGAERVPLDGELLVSSQPIPAKIPGFGKSGHLVRRGHEGPGARPKFAVKELSERAIDNRLKLAYVDIVLADERLDLPRAAPRILVSRKQPVVERLRFKPLV